MGDIQQGRFRAAIAESGGADVEGLVTFAGREQFEQFFTRVRESLWMLMAFLRHRV